MYPDPVYNNIIDTFLQLPMYYMSQLNLITIDMVNKSYPKQLPAIKYSTT